MRVLLNIAMLFSFVIQAEGQIPVHQASNTYLVEFNDSTALKNAVSKGVTVSLHPNNIATLRIPQDADFHISDLGFCNFKPARRTKPLLERARVDVNANLLQEQLEEEKGYTGKGVIIGITDWGFDYSHPMFYDTSLNNTRIIAAWDQYKTSGPSPSSFHYGTEYQFPADLEQYPADTINIYGYATHGSHVAGIAGGSGAGTKHRGIAPEAEFLFTTFLVDEAAFIDAVSWMKSKADELDKRLVINMSWGLYDLGPIDGTSLLSKALNGYSDQGIVFVTSAGNNGEDECHIRKHFNSDTLKTLVQFYPYSAHPEMWGQGLHIWGEQNHTFTSQIIVVDQNFNEIAQSPLIEQTTSNDQYYGSILIGSDTVKYRVISEISHETNQKPRTQILVNNKQGNHRIGLKVFAADGTIDVWNITYLNTLVGNWGMPLSAPKTDWTSGNSDYTLGEPASTQEVITVGAYTSEFTLFNGEKIGGELAPFSSVGPTIDYRQKPDISAPGVSVMSSVSSFTNRPFTEAFSVDFGGKSYPFARFSGTSMSSPVVTGVVALILQANPDLSPKQVKQILTTSARQDEHTSDTVDQGSIHWGYGKVDAQAAVKMALETTGDLHPSSFTFYPNPASSLIHIKGDYSRLQLFDSWGRLLESYSNPNFIDVSTLPRGIYLLRNATENMTYKLILKD